MPLHQRSSTASDKDKLKAALEAANKQLNENIVSYRELKAQLEGTRSEADVLKEDNRTLQEEDRTLKDEARNAKEENRSLKEENATLKEETRDIKEETRAIKDESRVLKDEIRALKEDNRQLKDDNRDLKDESHRLTTEKPAAQGGLLFMLFLVGAFVLSSRHPPSIPRVSEDVRAASATLLDNVLKDAGVVQSATGNLEAMAPPPSGTSWAPTSTPSMPTMGTGLDAVAPSMLSDLSDSLTQPTQEQTNEQLFGLSAAQYNGLNSQDFLQSAPERSTSQGRRNLAEVLANMRRSNGAAEVYTRSLLWDQLPTEVVRNFAKIVAESNMVAEGKKEEKTLPDQAEELLRENNSLREALHESLREALREALRHNISDLKFRNPMSKDESAQELKKRFAELLRPKPTKLK